MLGCFIMSLMLTSCHTYRHETTAHSETSTSMTVTCDSIVDQIVTRLSTQVTAVIDLPQITVTADSAGQRSKTVRARQIIIKRQSQLTDSIDHFSCQTVDSTAGHEISTTESLAGKTDAGISLTKPIIALALIIFVLCVLHRLVRGSG